jgi:2-oxo-4-hydroxy-4-carboxy-5-ureidoimidazoline decarboxylase
MSVTELVANSDGESDLVGVASFDRAPYEEAAAWLRPCCASTRWISELVLGRPFGSLRALSTASDDIIGDLRLSDVAEALAAHPRIGERAAGADLESSWSRSEQSATKQLAASVADQLVAGNVAYEQRFGHVFLICATGRSAPEMLTALQERLANPTEREREVVREELRAIVRLRLIKTFR